MPKTKAEKTQLVKELVKNFKEMKSAVFADFSGLKVKEATELRRLCRQEKVFYGVSKKTLLKIAAEEAGLDFDPYSLKGSYAMACSSEDEAAPARLLAEFAKKHETLKIIGGILNGKSADKAAIVYLAALPSKTELLAKLAGSLQAPLAGLMRVFFGNLRGLVQVLNAIKVAKT